MTELRFLLLISYGFFGESLVNPKCYPKAIGGRCGWLGFDCDPSSPKQICIPISAVRNCVRDCANGSYELCGDAEILCDTYPAQCGKCVAPNDVQRSCADRKYERLCEESGTIKCAHTKNCIFVKWLADGQDDCGDGSDEDPCEQGLVDCKPEISTPHLITLATTLPPSSTTVLKSNTTKSPPITTSPFNNSLSIDVSKPCPPANFRCNSGKCISYSSIFDGKNDCGDNSDENYCTVEEDSCPPHRPCSFQPDVGSFGCGCPHGWNRTEAGMCWEMTTSATGRTSPLTTPPTTTVKLQPIQALIQHRPSKP